MTDYISRQAAIEAAYPFDDNERRLVDALEELPSAQRWIPCSEKLPEEYVDVLVWFEYYRFGEYNRMYSTYGIGTYDAEYDKWWINHESGWRDLHVFAWMPMPEPYTGEES